MHNLLDALFNGMGGSEMYRAQIFPELWPNEPQMMLDNWSIDDLEMYVGGKFTPGYSWPREKGRMVSV
jgi:hypothetical protein